jgi:CO/xanthine dehydrogenase FAD-binding subunit
MTNGVIEEARVAIGCIGPKAERLRQLESKMTGTTISEAKKIIREQKSYLHGLLRPVNDLLGSAEYKLHMSAVLLSNALERAIGGNQNGHG